jgi:uncharacterized membrane protein
MSAELDFDLEDTFQPLATAGGVFLIVVSLATVVAFPWATNNDILVSLFQLLGVVGTVAVGAGLIWVARQ